MDQKILITGSNGLLGSKLIRLLEKNQVDFLATSMGENRFESFEIPYQKLDVTEESEVYAVLDSYRPDAVIHCAAYTHVDGCETDRDNCYQLNVKAVRNLARSAEEFGAHLIHLSTDFIFNGKDGPYLENSKADPLGYYGETKFLSEQLLEGCSSKYTILRTSIVYGYEPHIKRNNIILWLRQSFLDNKSVNIVDDQYRCITWAEDLAELCFLTAVSGKTGIYNATGAEYMSMLQLAKRMAKYYGASEKLIHAIKTEDLGQKAVRPPKTEMIINKAQKDLNYTPHSLEESLDQIETLIKSQN
jgi:dTDP-4-dehydrorhamnose reductase